MINLIGWAVGNAIAREARVPTEEVARLSLLGAASPSPLLGAVLVRSALDRSSDDKEVRARRAVEAAVKAVEEVVEEEEEEDAKELPAELGQLVVEVMLSLREWERTRATRDRDPEAFTAAAGQVRENLKALTDAITEDEIRGPE